MAFDVNDARKLANENGFDVKLQERIEEIENDIKRACENGWTSTCVFAHCNDADKNDIDREAKKHFLRNGFTFKRTGMNGGVPQTTEDICW